MTADEYLRALWLHMQEAFEEDWDARDLGGAVLSDMLERGIIQRGAKLWRLSGEDEG